MSFFLNVVDNYVTEVAASMLFGLGYYLFKGMKKKKEGDEKVNNPETGMAKMKLEGALERWNYAKSIEDYNILIKENYGKMEAYEILNIMVNKGLSPNIETYNALLLNSFYLKNFDWAINLREEILDPAGPVVPNTYTFNILIKGLGMKYKSLMKNEKIKINIDHENYLSKTKEFDEELEKLIKNLNERNVFMDVIAHNTILDCLIDQGRLKTAWDYFQDMKNSKFPNIKCDNFTYSTILKGIKNTKNLEEFWLDRAFDIFYQVKEVNHVEESFYNSILECCIKFKNINKAERFFSNMQIENNFKIKEFTYFIMIKGYSNNFNLHKVLETFDELKKAKYEEFLKFKNKIISGEKISNLLSNKLDDCETKSNFDNILMKKETPFANSAMKNTKNDPTPYPTTITYGAVLNTCIRCNDIDKAEEISYEMDKLSIHKNSFIYSIMINGYRKSRNYAKAIYLYEKLVNSLITMAAAGLDFDKNSLLNSNFNLSIGINIGDDLQSQENINVVIFNNILDCCIECERFDKMHEIFEFLKTISKDTSTLNNLNIVPDLITYSIMMKGYAKNNQIDKVMEIYNFLSNSNEMVLDEVLYNTLLDCFARNSDEESLVKIFCDMRKKNIKMSVVTYGVVIKLYTNIGDTVNVTEVFEDMISKGIKPTVIIYQLLLRLFSKKGMYSKAIDVFRHMLKMNITPDYMIYTYIIKMCFNNFYLKESVEFVILSIEQGVQLEESYYDYLVDYLWGDNQFSFAERKQMMGNLFDSAIKNELNFYISKYIIDKMNEFLDLKIKNQKISYRINNKSNQQIGIKTGLGPKDCPNIDFHKFTINEDNFNNNINYKNTSELFDKYSRIEQNIKKTFETTKFPTTGHKNNNYIEEYNDNQSQFSSLSFLNNKGNKNKEEQFEYELDLNSKNEYFYSNQNNRGNDNKNYSNHRGNKNKVNYNNNKKTNISNSNKNIEKSIYDL